MKKIITKQKCQTCGKEFEIYHEGQIKKYCSKECRLKRHNKKTS